MCLGVARAKRASSDDFLGSSPTERAKKCDTDDQRKKDMSQLVCTQDDESHWWWLSGPADFSHPRPKLGFYPKARSSPVPARPVPITELVLKNCDNLEWLMLDEEEEEEESGIYCETIPYDMNMNYESLVHFGNDFW